MVKKQAIRSSRSGRKKGQWRPFAKARADVRTLGLKSRTEWNAYARSGEKPDDIPVNPVGDYKEEWQDWGDWLGRGGPKKGQYRPFVEARAFVHTLGLKRRRNWGAYSKSGDKPGDIPANPGQFYRTEGQSWGDWLGTGIIAPQDRQYRPFTAAREFVHTLDLK
jgi:hypothetical protein